MTNEFEYKILDVHETEGRVVVEVEHEYGKQKIGLNAEAKYLGKDGKPRWRSQVEELLMKQYGNRDSNKAIIKTKITHKDIGKTFKITKEAE